MKINITAATGQLGKKVVSSLQTAGVPDADIITSVRNPDNAQALFPNMDIRHSDYEQPESLRKAFQGTDVLLIIPSLADVVPRIIQHDNILNAACQAQVKRIVFAGFAAAEPHSKFLMAPYMLYAESAIRLSGLDWTLVRNGVYLDPVADWLPDLVRMGRLPYPVKHGKTAYISRNDLARALAAACLDAAHSGKLYHLTGPQAVTMTELAAYLSQAAGVPIRFDSVSEDEFREINRKDNIPEHFIDILVSMYRAVDNNEFDRVTDHVQLLTGTPAANIDEYLKTR